MNKPGRGSPPPQADEPAANAGEGLSLEDTLAQNARGLGRAPKTGKSGYNPYDAGVIDKAAAKAKKKPTDLRKLSEWIRLKREVETQTKDGKDSEEK